MSMHLVGPYLTTTSYKKRKNTVTKAKQQQWQLDWQQQCRERRQKGLPKISFEQYVEELHGRVTKSKPVFKELKTNYNYPRSTQHIPSVESNGPAVCAAPASKQYTGTAMVGIAVMHKSNSIPVFSKKDAQDVSAMRRG